MTVKLVRLLSLMLLASSLSSHVYGTNRVQAEVGDDDSDTATTASAQGTNTIGLSLSASPDSYAVKSLCEAGMTLAAQGKFEQAKAFLDKAQTLAPQSAQVKRAYAYLYLSSNQPKLALILIGELAKSFTLTSGDRIIEGYAYWSQKELYKAEVSFRQAVELNGSDPNAAGLYIRCLMANLKWSLAVAECDKALKKYRTVEKQREFLSLRSQAVQGKTSSAGEDNSFANPPKLEMVTPFLRRSKGG